MFKLIVLLTVLIILNEAAESTNKNINYVYARLAQNLEDIINEDIIITNLNTTLTDAQLNANIDFELENNDFIPNSGDAHNFDWILSKKTLLSEPKTNIIMSPFSVKLLLLLLAEAAGHESDTKKELELVYSNIRKPFAARDLVKKALKSLNSKDDENQLNFGTKIFVDDIVNPRQRFKSIAESVYLTKVEKLTFKQSLNAVSIINDWCSMVTNGHIKNLVQESDVKSSDIIMVNSMYFKGLWRQPFKVNETIHGLFLLSTNQHIKTQYMRQTNIFYYLDSSILKAKLLRIPYKGKKFSMILVLPHENNEINEVIINMNNTILQRAEWLMDEVEVNIAIPKFKINFKIELKTILKKIGINEIFSEDASLPLLNRSTGTNKIRVSNIVQKSGFSIDEEGSIAFVASQVELVNKFGVGKIREFIADRPFLFYIQDESTGTLMFAGKVMNPSIEL